jgi:gamma-glutamylcyclotransferase (GGCT)/AIG2-like uncharacterized protein YtfP
MNLTCFSLFVYGSLRKGFQNPVFNYIHDYFDFVGNARVKGLLYDMGDYPAAVPSQDERFIVGELYSIKHPDEFAWAIGQLDDYEGISPEPGEQASYRRELVTVYVENRPVKAWIYWYAGDVSGKPMVASGDVFQYYRDKLQGPRE